MVEPNTYYAYAALMPQCCVRVSSSVTYCIVAAS